MPYFLPKSNPIVAQQWHPGVKLYGVQGENPNMLCGCLMLGSDFFDKPHVHPGPAVGIVLTDGDWIIYSYPNAEKVIDVWTDGYMRSHYVEVS